jgi:hypothetical protein
MHGRKHIRKQYTHSSCPTDAGTLLVHCSKQRPAAHLATGSAGCYSDMVPSCQSINSLGLMAEQAVDPTCCQCSHHTGTERDVGVTVAGHSCRHLEEKGDAGRHVSAPWCRLRSITDTILLSLCHSRAPRCLCTPLQEAPHCKRYAGMCSKQAHQQQPVTVGIMTLTCSTCTTWPLYQDRSLKWPSSWVQSMGCGSQKEEEQWGTLVSGGEKTSTYSGTHDTAGLLSHDPQTCLRPTETHWSEEYMLMGTHLSTPAGSLPLEQTGSTGCTCVIHQYWVDNAMTCHILFHKT